MRCEAFATRCVAEGIPKLFHRRANPGRDGARVTAIRIGADFMLLHLVVGRWHDMQRADQRSLQVSWRGAVAVREVGRLPCQREQNGVVWVAHERESSQRAAHEGVGAGVATRNKFGPRPCSG